MRKEKDMINTNHPLYLEDLAQAAAMIPAEAAHKTVLITGASGLIGSFLTDSFLFANQHSGCGIHVYAMGRNLQKLQARFADHETDGKLTLLARDILVPLDDNLSFDYIIHLASNADPKAYAAHPAGTITTNVIGTYHVLEYAKKHPGCRVFLASTMEVYGTMPPGNITTEEEFGLIDFNKIRSGYPEGKRTSELMLRGYAEEYGIEGAVGRLGYIYGPTMTETDSKVVAQFIRKAMAREDIVLKSRGEQRRSYCYISDAAAGVLTVLFKGETGAYNIANRNSNVTICGMAKTAAELAGTKVIFDLPEADEKKGFSVSQDALLNEDKLLNLGWTPRYTLEDGLKRTIRILT